MKKIEIISENENYTAANLGSLDKIGEYTMIHSKLNINVPGKVFISEALKTTGLEMSFQEMPPKMEMPFWHAHNDNEELYIFLKGEGEFLIDDDSFTVKESSIVRIAPKGKRTWKNNSEQPMTLMVIQTKENSLEHFGISDGFRL